jgi:hypothetical protein
VRRGARPAGQSANPIAQIENSHLPQLISRPGFKCSGAGKGKELTGDVLRKNGPDLKTEAGRRREGQENEKPKDRIICDAAASPLCG